MKALARLNCCPSTLNFFQMKGRLHIHWQALQIMKPAGLEDLILLLLDLEGLDLMIIFLPISHPGLTSLTQWPRGANSRY